MYGSVGAAPSMEWRPPQIVSYATLAANVITFVVVVYVVFLTNETVSLLRPMQPSRSDLNRQDAGRLGSLPPSNGDTQAPHILVVHAGDDNLRELGAEVARGARTLTPHVRVLHVANASFSSDVLWADGVLLGSNVYNANVDPVLMQWINTWDMQRDLSHKIAGAFVVAGGLSAGEEAAQLALLRSMLVLRLVVVGGATWTSAFGASAVVDEGPYAPSSQYPPICFPSRPANSSIAAIFLDKAFGLGVRVASVAAKLTRF
ncbi:hypothetical protein H310_10498 [Aphanomyces invadans]|uniref:NADPH-dependent FMN reductase-like domain-containing protein n=1 Tax=Aphanomyces invadans TaxID=157072 RepID=A0A024TRU4_9STRA|nr:hypothetical protein H310_10498 [Aphanomyces invadans]ETV96336.1 hypothetical protein H310_10498 [Aphanomyces invadans]|eukprot:XP_008875128.1 hypothetical protein H310_10498 [Aphanomyces invadans]